ncbi:S-layer homology domain-containing protein [bacterium]|nr:S-layer homology domain-containing protein [bacterium]
MKRFQKLLIALIAIFAFQSAQALEIVDVKANYWASQEIIHAIQNGYIYVVDDNKFKPEGTMSRAEFVTALLKVIGRQNDEVKDKTNFKDLKSSTPMLKDIMLSEQIRMAFGYPDRTFKPNRPITHNETMAMIANITKDDYKAQDISTFKDYKSIPIWAERAYIKNVANGLYVNHPDEMKFTPSNTLTRAEAAVLFDRVSKNLDKFLEKYRNIYDNLDDLSYAKFLGADTLDNVEFAPNHAVRVYDTKKVIEAGNIIIATDITRVRSRKDYVGDVYTFTAPNDVYSTQGTFLYPQGTEFYARDEKKGYSAWRSRREKSNVVFYKYTLPSGQTYDMAGVPFTNNGKLLYVGDVKKTKKAKVLNYTESDDKNFLLDCAHQSNPVIDYKLLEGKTIYVLITGDLIIPQNDEYINKRTKKSLQEQDTREIENLTL